ncbi:MAG: pinensin family lanthipeptide [Bacteroidota bacterium]
MKKNKKLKISELKVKSFVTASDDLNPNTVKGGTSGWGGITNGNMICEETINPDIYGVCRPDFTVACPDTW